MPGARTGQRYLRMSGTRYLPVVRQATATECGLACIVMVASYLGFAADLVQLRRLFPTSLKGATLRQIVTTCSALKLRTRAVKCRVSELTKLRTPCLLHWRFNHFVVLKSVRRDHLVLHDPARGCVKEPMSSASESFTGVALEVSRGTDFEKAGKPLQLSLRSLLFFDAGIGSKFVAGLLLALVCEILLLATPFYLQVVIDQVLGKGDALLLNTLAIGFAVLLLFQVVANAMRQLTFQYLSYFTIFDISARILHRLLRLPLTWFRSRDLGDVQHRVQSLRRVQDFVVHTAPALALDLLFIVLIAGVMVIYDPGLTAAVIAVAVVWCLWRASLFPLSLRLSSDIAVAESSVQTHFLETLRTAQTIKMVNGEDARLSEWQDLFANSTNARIRAGNLSVVDNALRLLLFQGARIAVIYALARRGLEGQMSVGMVSAFVAYLGMFIGRAGGIVDRIVEYKLLEVPLGRLADIVFSETEPDERQFATWQGVPSDVELRRIGFRYSDTEPAILHDCSCRIVEGGFMAVAGCSGAGKSTLLNIIAGTEYPSSGELLVGGVPLRDWNAQQFRRQAATIFQDDCLLKGSVAENIALFAASIDMARVRQAAEDACIANEIESLPMGYETRIGDLGSSMSKGQVQRILLARALYRRPRLLLLDEATSGLDAALEKKVVNMIAKLDITRIAVTHSDQMMQAAHEVVWLNNGTLLSSRPELNV